MDNNKSQQCPIGHEQSMMLIEDGTHYECQNPKCRDYRLLLLQLSCDKDHQQYREEQRRIQEKIDAEKKALDESTAKAILWVRQSILG
ncbi:MAG: hypothetical protein WAU55_01920 [Dehalococcoidales bacterium]|jgi:hypothetical protein